MPGEHPDPAPAERLDVLRPCHVTAVLPGVGPVLFAVVFGRNHELRPAHVQVVQRIAVRLRRPGSGSAVAGSRPRRAAGVARFPSATARPRRPGPARRDTASPPTTRGCSAATASTSSLAKCVARARASRRATAGPRVSHVGPGRRRCDRDGRDRLFPDDRAISSCQQGVAAGDHPTRATCCGQDSSSIGASALDPPARRTTAEAAASD